MGVDGDGDGVEPDLEGRVIRETFCLFGWVSKLDIGAHFYDAVYGYSLNLGRRQWLAPILCTVGHLPHVS
jgi:hypothetical protein